MYELYAQSFYGSVTCSFRHIKNDSFSTRRLLTRMNITKLSDTRLTTNTVLVVSPVILLLLWETTAGFALFSDVLSPY